ncbi:helix-turn-helix transcriptional regulator [Streptomyces sp. NPDC000410]|uniref:helix-turn-helix domain-containing protein n=1 Tax=Streptomyces sp. NPDC000410 TaxID=3154254 RepID=UPI00332A6A8D
MTDHSNSQQNDDNVPTSMRHLATQMKALREWVGLTQREFSKKVGFSESQIASVEQLRRPMKMDLAVQLEKQFNLPGVFTSVVDELLKEPHPSWFEPFAEAEAEAIALSTYQTQLIHGLLQTEAYTRGVCAAYRPALEDEEIERRLAARLARQQLLTRSPSPHLSFILEEVTLRRPTAGDEAQREQLHRLLEAGQERHIEIQVMPTERGNHAGLEGPFTLVETPDQGMGVYLEVQGTGQLITERRAVNRHARRYGILQSQALSPEESAEFIKQLATGER